MSKNTANHLFPSEDESLDEASSVPSRQVKPKEHKKRKPTPPSGSHPSLPSTSKKHKINPITPVTKPTARELFGSDSDDDALEVPVEKKPTPIYSYITRRLANGFSRQMNEEKKVLPADDTLQSSNVISNNDTRQFNIPEYDINDNDNYLNQFNIPELENDMNDNDNDLNQFNIPEHEIDMNDYDNDLNQFNIPEYENDMNDNDNDLNQCNIPEHENDMNDYDNDLNQFNIPEHEIDMNEYDNDLNQFNIPEHENDMNENDNDLNQFNIPEYEIDMNDYDNNLNQCNIPEHENDMNDYANDLNQFNTPKLKNDMNDNDLNQCNIPEHENDMNDYDNDINYEHSCISKTIHCDKCKVDIPEYKYRYHNRTNIHKSNCLMKSRFENVEIIATAFKNRIMTYRLNPSIEDENLIPEAFLDAKRNNISEIIKFLLSKNTSIKVNFELFAYFMLPNLSEQQLKSFNTKYKIIYNSTDFNSMYTNLIEVFKKKLTEFEHCESGWSFVSISHLEININKYSPMRGGTYLELPDVIKNSKSCLNIHNNDDYCFLWSVVAALYPAKNNVCRTTSYPHFSSIFNLQGITFPPSFKDIKLFEKNNCELSINIYGLNEHYIVTGPLYATSCKKDKHINLLYFENNNKGHYCLIRNLLRLVRRQVSSHKGRMYLCETCLQFFTSEIKYNSHSCSKILTILPEKNSVLRFKHYERKQKINFVIYADFESLLLNYKMTQNDKNTIKKKLHQPSCFAFYVCCSHDSSLNKYVTYRGPNCVEVFIKRLIEEVKIIHNILIAKKSMHSMTKEQIDNYSKATTCHICNDLLFDDKVCDHDHITSEYRGAAHSHCNLIYRVCPFIPIIFHNLAGYDSHIFITELSKYDGEIKIIAQTKEKYLTITKIINTGKGCKPIQIKFIDSFQFLSSSLENLSTSLTEKDFIHLLSHFPDKDQFNLLRRKGIYPYEYISSWQKYNETQLPAKDHFYNTLQMKHITDAEYQHAQNVWNYFNISSLGEYTDLYLKCDVLLLCDVFENFRNICLQHYKLDPAYYVTSPGLSWDAMLLYTGVQLELIHDLEIYEMLEKGIRGGLAQCSHRYAKANNIYLPQFDNSKPSTYLIYLDCNNLYGHAMTKKLPISEFKFMTNNDIKKFNALSVSDDAEYGYILEVDLAYPDHLHNLHNDLPFAPEKFIPIGGKTQKLIANVYDKYNYIIHYVHLKECIKNGLILKNIHRILCFRQENFLKKYIDLNTTYATQQAASTSFEKDFFKLLNNSIFGKTIENKRKHVDVKLVTKWNDTTNKTNKEIGAEKLITKPNLKSISIFNENFLAIQLSPEKLILDRPIYIGFAVLEYSKQHVYNFHYNFIKTKYGRKAKLCYTDTDSLLYLIHTDDFYKDMRDNLSKFDTSNFEIDNHYGIPKVNERIPGLFKDELGGDPITEFIGLRAKLYCIKSLNTQINKAKGVSKPITRCLKSRNFKDVLFKNLTVKRKMNMIKAMKHMLYTQEVNKVVLNRIDDKRQVLGNQIETVPWGHCSYIC